MECCGMSGAEVRDKSVVVLWSCGVVELNSLELSGARTRREKTTIQQNKKTTAQHESRELK